MARFADCRVRVARDSPVVIGGVGGSGTRVVARIVARSGRFMGARLNESNDALDICDFDWQYGLDLVTGRAGAEVDEQFEDAVARHLGPRPSDDVRWGWKAPHSLLLLPFLAERFSDLRFVHVIRDGRDMAFSSNQNQLRHYGPAAIGPGDDADPIRRIRYWAWANHRGADDGQRLLGDRYLCVRFEDLCGSPVQTIARVEQFALGSGNGSASIEDVQPPESIGRGVSDHAETVPALERAAHSALVRFGYLTCEPSERVDPAACVGSQHDRGVAERGADG